MGSGSDTSDDEFSPQQFRIVRQCPSPSKKPRPDADQVSMLDMTFPAEYTGYVDYMENRANDDCDCMTTLVTADPSQRLVVYKWRQ
jgi:hypothetical protein